MGISKASPALLCSTLSFALLPLASAVAQANEAGPSDMSARLDPIVVTATLGPRTVGESLSSVTVIDEEEIREKAPNEFTDLLRGQPGINVTGNGSFGKTTNVYTRGVKNAGTVFLVDGIKLHSATSGGASWQYFPTELIQRVELVRGPRSSLYGADAMGGVVQAFTLDPRRDQRGWLEAGAGNFDSQKTSAGMSGSSGNTHFSLSGLHKESDGTAIVEDGEDRGFRNTAGLGRIVHEFDNGGEANVLLLQSQGNTEFEGDNTDYMIRTVGFGLSTPVNDHWKTAIKFSESRDETEQQIRGSEFNTRLRQARWENTFTFDVHELVVGTELQQDEVSSSDDYTETSRTNAAVFSQLRLNFGPFDTQLSLRSDDNESYGTNDTGGVALGYKIDQSHRVRASYGTAFRAPTFNDLFFPYTIYPGGFEYIGNPDLEPEESENYELGLSGNYNHWFWDVAVYQMDIDNLISSGQVNGIDSSVNVDEARIRGAEIGVGYENHGWRAALAVTYLDPEDRETNTQLARRTKKTARLDIDKKINKLEIGGSLLAEGKRYDFPGNTNELAGFATLDLRAGWRFERDWSARLTVNNVLDKEYSTAGGYITAGRTAMLTVRYDFQ